MKKVKCDRCWNTKSIKDFQVTLNGREVLHDFCRDCREAVRLGQRYEQEFFLVHAFNLKKRDTPKQSSSHNSQQNDDL